MNAKDYVEASDGLIIIHPDYVRRVLLLQDAQEQFQRNWDRLSRERIERAIDKAWELNR